LHEATEATHLAFLLDEAALPLSPAVRGACEILGLDPLFVANEGKLVAVVAPELADAALACIHKQPFGENAAIIAEVQMEPVGQVLVRGPRGALGVLDEPSGAPLPRIC